MEKELLVEMRQAIKKNDINKVKMIVEKNTWIVNEVTVFGTFLHDAANKGFIDIAQYLIDCGIDVNKKAGTCDASAITEAAFKGHLDMVKLLYQNGTILDVSTLARNPLFAAIYNNHFDVVKYLVEKGIDLSPSYGLGDYDSLNAYQYAKLYGRTEIANYLKERMT